MGFNRLSIIDLNSSSDQPFSKGESEILLFNGEIYNYREIRSRLSSTHSVQFQLNLTQKLFTRL